MIRQVAVVRTSQSSCQSVTNLWLPGLYCGAWSYKSWPTQFLVLFWCWCVYSLNSNLMNFLNEQFSPAEDSQEGPLRFLQSHGEVVELLLHQETSRLLRKIHSHHGAERERGRHRKTQQMFLNLFRYRRHVTTVSRPNLLTCGPCELCRRHRSHKHLPAWTETPWRSRSAPGRLWSEGKKRQERIQ